MSELQFNYLFTLKNAHLSINSYNFWMQPNTAMKFAAYVAWILLCKCCKFDEINYSNSRDIEFFLGDYLFLSRPVYTVFHKIGTPLYFCNNFFNCCSIWMKIKSLYSLGNWLSGDVVCNCIFYKYSLYTHRNIIAVTNAVTKCST